MTLALQGLRLVDLSRRLPRPFYSMIHAIRYTKHGMEGIRDRQNEVAALCQAGVV